MKTSPAPDVKADLEALCESVDAAVPADPGVLRRVQARSDEVRSRLGANGPLNIAVDLLRESREDA